MLTARGFNTLQDHNGCIRASKDEEEEESCLVVFLVSTPKLGVKSIREMFEGHAEETHILLVFRDITSFAQKHLAQITGCEIETFALHQLQFDIMRHVLVPAQHAVDPKDVTQLGIRAEQLPLILASDPVARYYGWTRGTVTRATVASPEGHMYYEYRRVS